MLFNGCTRSQNLRRDDGKISDFNNRTSLVVGVLAWTIGKETELVSAGGLGSKVERPDVSVLGAGVEYFV